MIKLTNLIAETGVDRLAEAAADQWMWTVGGSIAIVAIVVGGVKSMVSRTTRERTRREIAAYIAEGSMTPEQGERIIQARDPSDDD